MSDAFAANYRQLCQHTRETAMLQSVQGLLEWDERTMMPPAAGPYRADQVALLSGEIHKRQTAPEVGRWLDELAAAAPGDAADDESQAVIRELRRDYQKKTRLPQKLVEELSRASVLGQQAWVEARKADDFEMFLPVLERTIELKRQEAAAIGFEANPYDALLDDYEPGETTANATRVLSGLRDALRPLLDKIAGSSRQLDASLLARSYPIVHQEEFGREVAAALGFDFEAGRLDVTEHPFCGGAGPRDVRLTTRYRDDDFGDAFFSTLHEAGHGLYEQGLPPENYGLPTGEAASLGIHESQSRLWENQVGRSRAFWSYWRPRAQDLFPAALGDASVDSLYRAVNRVEPSLIRVDADEATYNLHIFIRFELEQAMLNDDLRPVDLPEAWRQRYRQDLGVEPTSDRVGVLQDVHWGAGLVGYFPTYALGNLYAAQFFAQARRDLGDFDQAFRNGQFAPLLAWLRDKIHRYGRRYSAADLVRRVTGQPLSHAAWIEQMEEKYGELYAL